MTNTRRILCVWLPYWATTRLRHARSRAAAQPDAPDEPRATIEPLATIETVRGIRRLAGCCALAEGAGLHVGQALTQARALCPALVVADAEPEQDATALAALAQWATRHTPLAAACAPDTLWLDISGCAHLHDGEANLAQVIVAKLQGWGLAVGWAVAGTTGAAWALARHACGTIVETGEEAAALAALPIEALRLEPAATAALRRLGLKTVAALDRLPRAELAARFGQQPRRRLDQALGALVEPIAWPPPPPDWTEHAAFAEPILTTEACLAVLDRLAGRLCTRLAAQRLGGRQFVAGFRRLDGSTRMLAVATALPVHDPAYVCKLLAEKLDGLDPGFGIEAAWLAAPLRNATTPEQHSAFGAAGAVQQRLAQLVDTLANMLRQNGRLWRAAPRDSHIPEQATQRIGPLGTGWRDKPPPAWQHDPATPRPIRLLERPEPIEVMAVLPDAPPLQFRWRGALHRVRAATGPERIAEEWWTARPGGTRDYYQVEDNEGGRFWVFRDAAAWFLHGLFA